MEKRFELRFQVHQAVQVTLLARDLRLAGHIADISGRGMRLLLNAALPVGAAVRVDLDDSLLLGEVRYCIRNDDQFAIGLQLDQGIPSLSELDRLLEDATV